MTLWLDRPIMLHGSRAYMCMLDSPAMCQYQQGYWRFWYEADHRYALPTVYFFITAIALFALGYAWTQLAPRSVKNDSLAQNLTAYLRWKSYAGYRIERLNWNSAPLGVLLLGAAGAIFFFAMTLGPKPYYWPNTREISYGDSPPIATRAGWMALACMPFVIATSSKTNMITAVTGVSHEKLQVFHRWSAYAMFVLALIHTFPFIVHQIWAGTMVESFKGSIFYWSGVVALIAQAWLSFASFSPLRNWSYEFFKISHFVAAIVFLVVLLWHCDFTLTSADYFIAAACIYVPCFIYAQLRTYLQLGVLTGTLSTTENGYIRVTVPVKNIYWRPGQHCFIRFLGMNMHTLTSHPFSICSVPSWQNNQMEFYIRAQRGFTARLWSKAQINPGSSIKMLMDGPYGGIDPQKLEQSRRLMVIAGGSGSGWALSLIERFVQLSEVDPERSLRVIIATREVETVSWFQSAIDQVLGLRAETCKSIASSIAVEIHFTGKDVDEKHLVLVASSDESQAGVDSDSIDDMKQEPRIKQESLLKVKKRSGRPNLEALIHEDAVAHPNQDLGLFACGPASMQQDIRETAAAEQWSVIRRSRKAGIYLHLEHFSWA